MLFVFNVFHLNLAYSAIEVSDRHDVVRKCYWPLLELTEELSLPFGIELSGYTLKAINSIDPCWIKKFKNLLEAGTCELIGSGYSQIIGPLVPADITLTNLRLGQVDYWELLGECPKIALLNEQAFSKGLISLYQEAGYEAIISEWNNPASYHPEWDPEFSYFAQRAKGNRLYEIPVLWNQSISFQKFQRYAHGELQLDDFLAYLKSHKSDHDRAFSLYGNDVEVFDFRPGRFMTEAQLHSDGEWNRIRVLYERLTDDCDFSFVKPSKALLLNNPTSAHRSVDLASAAQPIPVKKQSKYNVIRWALTGRDDLAINTRCWRLYNTLKIAGGSDAEWRELCYLWSSDFRTHITNSRWSEYLERLCSVESKWGVTQKAKSALQVCAPKVPSKRPRSIRQDHQYVRYKGKRLEITFNSARGLAIESFVDLSISESPLFGTLKHGYFDDIRYAADFYSGHLTWEPPGLHKITDLSSVEPIITQVGSNVIVSARMVTPLGEIEKEWLIDDHTGELRLRYKLSSISAEIGSLRMGYVTLNPSSFQVNSLSFASHNGGEEIEDFLIDGDFNHGDPVSLLVSSNQGVGMTKGIATLGDCSKSVRITCDKTKSAVLGMYSHARVKSSFLTRFMVSVVEFDDTTRKPNLDSFEAELVFSAFIK